MNKDLIKMSSANVNQVTGTNIKTEWIIRENITEEELGRFPAVLTDKQAFDMLRLIRKYELIALNVGINTGKKKTVKVYDKIITGYEEKFKLAIKENERLSDTLDRLTRE